MEINSVLAQMREIQVLAQQDRATAPTPLSGPEKIDFSAVLQDSLKEVSATQQTAGAMSLRYASGDESLDLSEVMVAMQKSSLSFEAVVQVRNKMLKAYEEVMRMSV